MFCDKCGAPVQPNYNVCPKCGKLLPRLAATPSRLERHLRTLGILWIVCGALFLVPSLILLAIGSAVHFAITGEQMVRELGPLVLYLVGGSLLIVATGGICVGWGLLQRQPWARMAAIIVGFVSLFHPPFGTALGIYTLWVLLANDAGVNYDQMARAV
ncbi:MAG: zinc-ribbon domain-containing protein [bacterium]